MICLTVKYPRRDGLKESEGTDYGPQRRDHSLRAVQDACGVSREKTRSISHRSDGRKNRAGKVTTALLFAIPLIAAEPSTKARTIDYRDAEDIPHIYLLTGFSTELKLQKQETVANVQLGNSYFEAGFLGPTVNVKPVGTEPGKRTNVQILCLSGNEYSFIVEEVSKKPGFTADLKVFVNNADVQAQDAMKAPPKLYTSDQMDAERKQLADTEAQLRKEQESKKQAVVAAEQKAVASIRHDYVFFDSKGVDFHPSVWRDDKFTYVSVDTNEIPALFELKDGKNPSLIEKQFSNGRYTVPKILDEGELKIGKSQVKFRRVS